MATLRREPTSAKKIAELTEGVTFRTLARDLKKGEPVKVYGIENSKVKAKVVKTLQELKEALQGKSPDKFTSYTIAKKTKRR